MILASDFRDSSPADWEIAASFMGLCHCCAGPAMGHCCKNCHENSIERWATKRRWPGGRSDAWENFVAEHLKGLEQGERSAICPKCHSWNSNPLDMIWDSHKGRPLERRLLQAGETNLCQSCRCEDPEYQAYLDTVIAQQADKISEPGRPHKPARQESGPDGWVYFISDAEEKFVKIGWSSSRACRIKELQTGSPLTLKLLSRERALHPRKRERALHAAFAHLRIRGEWFIMDPEIRYRIAHKPKVTE